MSKYEDRPELGLMTVEEAVAMEQRAQSPQTNTVAIQQAVLARQLHMAQQRAHTAERPNPKTRH